MRLGEVKRKTAETDIALSFCADGKGEAQIATGIGFFDHMLTLFARHGLFTLCVECRGDLAVDGHHTVEDVGIALGQAIARALGDKAGIRRYGSAFVPMDEALAFVSLDLSGRPYLVYDAPPLAPRIGAFDSQLVEEFLRALAVHAGITLHVKIAYGKNAHHMVEAAFKALGRALSEAVQKDARIEGVLSTKGVL